MFQVLNIARRLKKTARNLYRITVAWLASRLAPHKEIDICVTNRHPPILRINFWSLTGSRSHAIRLRRNILCFAVSMGLVGCHSQPQKSSYDPMQQLAAARIAHVPLPATTPFDSAPDARAAYLDAYREGYRSGLV